MRKRLQPSYADKKKILTARLRRVEGQLRGIISMLEDERDCLQIVQQIDALASASREVAVLLLESHIRALVREAGETGDGEAAAAELSRTLRRLLKSAR